jgi:hypothetical protein
LHPAGHKKAGELNRRRNWHPECVEAWRETDPGWQRILVYDRDKGICARCGLNTDQLYGLALSQAREDLQGKEYLVSRRHDRALEVLMSQGYSQGDAHRRDQLWDADHVVELQDDGANTLENLQTLCVPCHKKKTQEERSKRK